MSNRISSGFKQEEELAILIFAGRIISNTDTYRKFKTFNNFHIKERII